MHYHTAMSFQGAFRGMQADAPIIVRVDGVLHWVSLVRPAWVADRAEDGAAARSAQYAEVLIPAAD
jgi:hypothetical protein